MSRRRRRWVGRLMLGVGGVLLALVVAELGLRVASLFVVAPGLRRAAPGTYTVLAWGDSFTYGLGSEDGRGYPEHLQGLLDEAWGPGAASVVNGGVPGLNSSQAADRLGAALAAVRPDLLILMVGHNNSWNFNDLHLQGGGPGLRLEQALGGLRVVKLLQLGTRWELGAPMSDGARRYFDAERKAEKEEKYRREHDALTAQLAAHPDDVYAIVKLAVLAEAGEDHDALLARARAVDSAEVDRLLAAQASIEAWHQAQRDRGEADYLERRPDSSARLYAALGPSDATVGHHKALLDEVLRADLATMTDAAQGAGATVVISGYASATKTASPVLRAFAEERGLTFVDQQADFDARVAAGDPMSRWFVLDGHCTSAGYHQVAVNLLPAVTAGR